MVDDRKHDFRLSLQEPSTFIDALEKSLLSGPSYVGEEVHINPRYGKGTFAILPVFDEDERPHFFHLMVRLPSGELTPELADAARELFAQLIAMDDDARAIPSQNDENEELAEVILLPETGQAVLHYYSNLWNSEWGVDFARGPDGKWACVGIPKPGGASA